jgi:phenylpropionate dioxygenase-like ring-hydroxylating dioxygenase large terminal subunit
MERGFENQKTLDQKLSTIADRHKRNAVLPGFAYRDEDVFDLEVERLFQREWVSVTCAQSVPEPGDVFPVKIAGQSLLVVRDNDGEVRVFYNLCRHRGAELADKPCKPKGGRLVCPYHAWSYNLKGEFLRAPYLYRDDDNTQPGETERDELGLISVRSQVWRDIVFVDLSGVAKPFESLIAPLDERLARWNADELRPVSTVEYSVAANWKLAAENFLDAYHLPVLHSQIGGGFKGALQIEDVEISDRIAGFVMPIGYDGVEPNDSDRNLPPFSGLGDEKLRIEVFVIFPNTLILVEPESSQVITLRPQGAGVTHESFANYVATDASQTDEMAELRAEWHRSSNKVNEQDVVLLEGLQRSRAMDAGDETRLSKDWDQTVSRFQRIWSEALVGA